MLHFLKKDLVRLIRDRDAKKRVEEKSDCRLLLEIINEAFVQTSDSSKQKILLNRGIELTGMSPENISEKASELGYNNLAQAYREYKS